MVAQRLLLSRPEAVTARRPLERSFGGGRTMPPHLTPEPQPPWGDDVPSSHQPVGAEGYPYNLLWGGGWLAGRALHGGEGSVGRQVLRLTSLAWMLGAIREGAALECLCLTDNLQSGGGEGEV